MYDLILHKGLTLEKWSSYPESRQVLMISNELNRAKNFIADGNVEAVNMCYERAFELTDLTTSDKKWQGKRREMRRFREMLAKLYADKDKNAEENQMLFIGLLRLSPEAYRTLYPAVQ